MGSSPLTRGGLVYLVEVVGADGLIPAYAGRTILCSRPSRSYRAHPGLRGADLVPLVLRMMRGAHPRLRGADYTTLDEVAHDVGSSPLTRGGPRLPRLRIVARGLIPAYAGRTREIGERFRPLGAHPRLRGADRPKIGSTVTGSGSSPLTRGGQERRCGQQKRLGLIPAYAGRTCGAVFCSWYSAAHPRLRGADPVLSMWFPRHIGSSPLTRGGRGMRRRDGLHQGLIPAYAGRTRARRRSRGSPEAHPRLRGADCYRFAVC